MPPNPDRQYDRTHLSLDWAEERMIVHRDFLAHSMRWSHIVKYMNANKYKDFHLLDIGCGKDQPLPRLIYANRYTGYNYTGVDINVLDFHPTLTQAYNSGKLGIELFDNCDAGLLKVEDMQFGQADVVACLECLEHMQPWIAYRLLMNIKALAKPGATMFFSTPVYFPDTGPAANHINEMGRKTLGAAFEAHGFTIVGNYGTFGNQRDIEPTLEPAEKALHAKLRSYYDSNALAIMFAPLHPEASRNNLWVLKNTPTTQPKFWEAGKAIYDPCQNTDIEELFIGRVTTGTGSTE